MCEKIPGMPPGRLDRRGFLALGIPAWAIGRATPWPARSALPGAGDAAGTPLAELAQTLIRSAREDVAELAAKWIASGADRTHILGAAFLAGAREVRPDPVGNALHGVMAIESAFLVTENAPPHVLWPIVLWALDDFKASQALDTARREWKLEAPPKARGSQLDAQAELEAALEQFDPERTDRALVSLLSRGDRAAVLESLWPFATRSLRDAGHRILHAAQCERTLGRIDDPSLLVAQDVLRTVAFGLANDSAGEHTQSFDAARALAPELPSTWLDGANAAEKSVEVLAALRGKSPADSQRVVVDAFAAGLGPATVWDGLRLYASELMLLRATRGNLFPVHTVTEMEAFGHVWQRARKESTLRLVVLQAAAWLASVRDAVVSNNGPYAKGPGIDTLAAGGDPAGDGTDSGPSSPASKALEQALVARDPWAAGGVLARAPEHAQRYVEQLCLGLARSASESHQTKYLGSILAESARVDPRWRAHVLVPGLDYLPGAHSAVSPTYERSLHALQRAGVLPA